MPRKPKNGKLSAVVPQAKNISRVAKAIRKTAQSQLKQTAKDLEKAKRTRERADAKALRQQLKQLEQTGIYNPLAHILTPYRKKRIRKGTRELEKMKKEGYAFAAFPKNAKQRKEIKKVAERFEYKATKKGLLVRPQGIKKHVRPARITFSKRFGGFVISTEEISKSKKSGKVYRRRSYTPLVPGEAMERQMKRFEKQLKKMPPLTKDQRLVFVFPNGNMSDTFSNAKLMMDRIESYGKGEAGLARLLDVLSFVIVEIVPAKPVEIAPGVFSTTVKGVTRHTDIENTGEGFTLKRQLNRDEVDEFFEGR